MDRQFSVLSGEITLQWFETLVSFFRNFLQFYFSTVQSFSISSFICISQAFAESQDYGVYGERVRKACWGYLCRGGAVELKEVCLVYIAGMFILMNLLGWNQTLKDLLLET